MSEGKTPPTGFKPDNPDGPVPDYIPTGKARREFAQKVAGNPAERQIEAERISREDDLYRGGFPVAGH